MKGEYSVLFVLVANRRGLDAENDLRCSGKRGQGNRGVKRQKCAPEAVFGPEMAPQRLQKAHFYDRRGRLQWVRSDRGY